MLMDLRISFLLSICFLWSFLHVHGGSIWLARTLVRSMCKRSESFKKDELPIAMKEDGRQGKKECEFISWTKCSAGKPCQLSRRNNCGRNINTHVEDGGEQNRSTQVESDGGQNSIAADGLKALELGPKVYHMLPSISEAIKIKEKVEFHLNSPYTHGSMSLWNATIGGFDKLKSNIRYHPQLLYFHGDMFWPNFSLAGNYSWKLTFNHGYAGEVPRKVEGEGFISWLIYNQPLKNVTGAFNYHEKLDTYQLDTFELDKKEALTSDGEWHGYLEGSTLDGKKMNLKGLYHVQEDFGFHLFPQIIRNCFNLFMPGHLPGRTLDLIFNIFTRYA